MKTKVLAFALVVVLAACSSHEPAEEKVPRHQGESRIRREIPQAPPKDFSRIRIPSFTAQETPSSPRSREVVSRVAPKLAAALIRRGLSLGAPVYMRVFKEERRLEVWVKGPSKLELFRTYRVANFSGGLGPKRREGDLQAPEGFYYVSPSGMNPWSSYHLSFNIGYPNAYDRVKGRTGSAIMIHGNVASIGCFAMTDEKIEEIYTLADAALRNGQRFFRVHVFPFRMTEGNMERHRESPWMPFWRNLKKGHDFFEKTGFPPDVLVRGGKYVFRSLEPESPPRSDAGGSSG